MAYREVGGHKTYWKFKETEPNTDMIDGIYHREIISKYGEQYEFENHDGSIHVLPAAGHLKYKMGFVKPGDRVRVTYLGEEILDNGPMKGRPAHQFRIFKDDEDFDDQEVLVDDDDTGLPEFIGL